MAIDDLTPPTGLIADNVVGFARALRAAGIPVGPGAVIDALNALRRRYNYVFTTGGIGPTHDDITADCVAKAFGVPIDVDPRALAIMQERLAVPLAERMDLRVLECPGNPEPIVEALWWHRQYEDDIAHAWLRRLIVETAHRL